MALSKKTSYSLITLGASLVVLGTLGCIFFSRCFEEVNFQLDTSDEVEDDYS